MRQLKDILYKAGLQEVRGDIAQVVNNVVFDSRQVTQGSLFIAVRGTQTDGHKYIGQAIEKGAVAIVCEELPDQPGDHINYIKVKNSSLALGYIAANYYENPSQNLKVIGVTGTNGKTTIASLLYRLFTTLGYPCGLLSTINNQIGTRVVPATHTTPDALQLNSLLSTMVAEGVDFCFMEVSSHAIAQHRVTGIDFEGGIFTNLSHDHLDYHKSFDEYRDAKKAFFDILPSHAFALVNADDRNSRVMLQNSRARKVYYGLKNMADYRCRILENRFDGLQLNMDGLDTWFRLAGPFNAYNLLAAYATAVLLGEPKDKVLTTLSGLGPVEGRFDHFTSPGRITAIVDYAHTPDALDNVLKTINAVRTGNEQVITVVGAGGNRDKTKRPIMASIACMNSNRVILTSDNPRFEKPETIIEEMKKGVPADKKKSTLVIVNREEAIKTACSLAQAGDIVLVAGKGHEKYQEIEGVKHPFDDKKVLEEMLIANEPENNHP